jgi:hypothetical protein
MAAQPGPAADACATVGTTPADDFLALNRSMIVSSETLSSFIKKVN